jgi:hypothetical protein
MLHVLLGFTDLRAAVQLWLLVVASAAHLLPAFALLLLLLLAGLLVLVLAASTSAASAVAKAANPFELVCWRGAEDCFLGLIAKHACCKLLLNLVAVSTRVRKPVRLLRIKMTKHAARE